MTVYTIFLLVLTAGGVASATRELPFESLALCQYELEKITGQLKESYAPGEIISIKGWCLDWDIPVPEQQPADYQGKYKYA